MRERGAEILGLRCFPLRFKKGSTTHIPMKSHQPFASITKGLWVYDPAIVKQVFLELGYANSREVEWQKGAIPVALLLHLTRPIKVVATGFLHFIVERN